MKNEESIHQKALFVWAKYSSKKYPELKLLHSIPNGANVSDKNRIRLVQEGLTKGIPDIHLPVSRGGYLSLYLELKSKTGSLSKYQKEVINLLCHQGNLCFVSRSLNQSIDFLTRYLNSQVDDFYNL